MATKTEEQGRICTATEIERSISDRVIRVCRDLDELKINANPRDLIVRNVEEYLLIQQFREMKIAETKKSVARYLVGPEEAPVAASSGSASAKKTES